jgi:hypothetical protein
MVWGDYYLEFAGNGLSEGVRNSRWIWIVFQSSASSFQVGDNLIIGVETGLIARINSNDRDSTPDRVVKILDMEKVTQRILVFAVKSTTLSSTVKVSEPVDQATMKLYL